MRFACTFKLEILPVEQYYLHKFLSVKVSSFAEARCVPELVASVTNTLFLTQFSPSPKICVMQGPSVQRSLSERGTLRKCSPFLMHPDGVAKQLILLYIVLSIYNFAEAVSQTYYSPYCNAIPESDPKYSSVLFENGILNNFPQLLSYNIRSFKIYNYTLSKTSS